MEGYKIRVNNESESKEAQELFFELGYEWHAHGKKVSYLNAISTGDFGYLVAWKTECFYEHVIQMGCGREDAKEITLADLRDMVVLKRNDVKDANYKSATDFYYVTVENHYYFWSGFAWCLSNADFIIGLSPIIDNPENKDPALISGAEAKIAWASGEKVEYQNKIDLNGMWFDITESNILGIFTDDRFIFRLKPKTVKIELEIPKPFEPKEGEEYFGLNNDDFFGYSKYIKGRFSVSLLAFRTEDDAKKAVEQLRKIKGAV